MTVIKNKAEEAISADIAKRMPHLPGDARVRKLREDAAAAFNASGLPHRRIEEWKYTDLRALLKIEGAVGVTPADSVDEFVKTALKGLEAETYVFVDGKLASKPKGKTQAGVTVLSFADTYSSADPAFGADLPETLRETLPETVDAGAASIIALNTALAADGAVVKVTANKILGVPIHLVFVSTGVSAVRNVISLGAQSNATIVESHAGIRGRQEFGVTDVQLGEGAIVHHIVRSETAIGDAFVSQTLVRTGKGATYKPFQFHCGSGVTRQQMTLTFAGEHGSLDFSSTALVRDNGHSDTTLVIDHAVPHCQSRELFKTVLDNTARGIFQGKVIVRPGAQKTDGKQMAQALMLSPDAEFDSKPELEIYADDVICGHGTTSAEIDRDMLFYCKSRGIPETEARALLIESFIGEAIDKVENENIRNSFMNLARAWLAAAHT